MDILQSNFSHNKPANLQYINVEYKYEATESMNMNMCQCSVAISIRSSHRWPSVNKHFAHSFSLHKQKNPAIDKTIVLHHKCF